VLYLGEETGKAQTLKLLNNLLSATGMAAACEAFILGTKAALDPMKMLEIINAGDASCSATRNKFPRSILPRRFDFGARMAITVKDISLAVEEAQELGGSMWIGQVAQQIWKFALSLGGADRDGTPLITYLGPWARVKVLSQPEVSFPATTDEPASLCNDKFVVLCEPHLAAALSLVLRRQGWGVTVVRDDATDQTGDAQRGCQPDVSGQHCTIVGVTTIDPEDQSDFLRSLGRGPWTIINMLPLPPIQAIRLADVLSAGGHAYLDALHTGTLQQIEAGQGVVIAGGKRCTLTQAESLLTAVAARVFRISDRPGPAHTMQQINESLFATLLAVTCEAFVAGVKAGLDPQTMTKIMSIETGRNAASANILPEQVATRRFQYGKRIKDAHKQLTLLSDEASRLGVTPLILYRARLLYGLAAQLSNPQDDITRLATRYENWAKTEVQSESSVPSRP
jgi:3-hydroxyisobutyrate dehydrogenase-like beta-hydroxyacid dehydrogenase